uniref:WW domain-containing protein n=1 Tax=Noctiluca scintillans TaxID=2966 RepID=A0A7S1AU12_NOCSC
MPGAPAPGFLDDYGGVQILEEKRDDYEPNSEEIENYAEWLGLDPEKDVELLYLAREGLRANLTEGWRACQNANGEIFYFNFETEQSSWDHPADESFRRLVQDMKRRQSSGGDGLPAQSDPGPGRTHWVPAGEVRPKRLLRCSCLRRCRHRVRR